MRIQEFGTNPKRPSRAGSRPARGHKEEPRYKNGISAEQENKFHVKLDKLVHNTFGHSSDEIKEGVINVPALSKRIVEMRKLGQTDEQIKAQLIKENIPTRYIDQAFAGAEMMSEGKNTKQEPPKPRNFVAKNAIQSGAGAHKDKKKASKQGDVKHKGKAYELAETWTDIEEWLDEEGKASRRLCTSGIPDKDLGASQLASCKSQGLRARDGEKSHLIGHGNSKVRITVGGKKIKGKKYGGPLPDYGTRKNQK